MDFLRASHSDRAVNSNNFDFEKGATRPDKSTTTSLPNLPPSSVKQRATLSDRLLKLLRPVRFYPIRTFGGICTVLIILIWYSQLPPTSAPSFIKPTPGIAINSTSPDPYQRWFDVEGNRVNPYFSFGKIDEHNAKIADKFEHCRSLGLLRNTSDPKDTAHMIDTPEHIAQGCSVNETTLLILSSVWFNYAFSHANEPPVGEMVYSQSIISTLNYWGYSYVFTSYEFNEHEMDKTMAAYDAYSGNVRAVWAHEEQVDWCFATPGCIKQGENGGIPAWHIFSVWWWDVVRHPLGAKWTFTPSPNNNHTFLSYSVEPTCLKPPDVRGILTPSTKKAYLFAKFDGYFLQNDRFPWSIDVFGEIQSRLGIEFISGFQDGSKELTHRFSEVGIVNYGKMVKDRFFEKLRETFVVVGMGLPVISPTPWDGLCMGVPFINPIDQWDEANPNDRTKWKTQHDWMTWLEPPNVYHVHKHDLKGLEVAIKAAKDTPIEYFIPDHMKFDAVCGYTADVLSRDWRAEGEEEMRERKARGEELYDL